VVVGLGVVVAVAFGKGFAADKLPLQRIKLIVGVDSECVIAADIVLADQI
jgi:hypothetical protein